MSYECHGHIVLDGINYKASMKRHKDGVDEAFVRGNLKALADAGVSFYRDGGDNLMVSAFAKKVAPEYGIDYRTPIYAIHKKGCYGEMFGLDFETMSEYKTLVTNAKKLGADFIKLMASGIMDYDAGGRVIGPALGYSELCEAVKIAEGEGLKIMAHVNGSENIKNALSAGVKSVEHGFRPDRDVIDLFLETGAVWVPTRSPLENLIGCGRFDDVVLRSILDEQEAILNEAYGRGAYIASGSDCGSYLVYQGKGTSDEYGYLESMGVDPMRGNRRIEELFK